MTTVFWQKPLCWLAFSLLAAPLFAQELPSPEVNWQRFAVSVAAHGSGTVFDSWTSWQHVEQNNFLADGGRFTSLSAGKKAGIFAAVTVLQVVVVKKWGKHHPGLERLFSAANFTLGGMYMGAGVRNLGVAKGW